MTTRTCEIDDKIFEGIPCDDNAESLCEGCAGDDNPDVCIRLDDCLTDNIIWIAQAPAPQPVGEGEQALRNAFGAWPKGAA